MEKESFTRQSHTLSNRKESDFHESEFFIEKFAKQTPSGLMRLFIPNINQMLKNEDIDGLFAALADRDEKVRIDAIKALAQTRQNSQLTSIKTLTQAIDNDNKDIRIDAIKALGHIIEASQLIPIKALTQAIHDGNKNIRRAAIKALIPLVDDLKLLSSTAREILFSALKESDCVIVRLRAYAALSKSYNEIISREITKDLVEATATEIRRMYSRTRTIDGYYDHTNENEVEWDLPTYGIITKGPEWIPEETVSDPDIDGIRKIIRLIPEPLYQKIYALSGEAKRYFNHD